MQWKSCVIDDFLKSKEEEYVMQRMTLKHTTRTSRFVHEHHDNCSECGMPFKESDTTHLGYTSPRKLIYVGHCCSEQLIETIVRYSFKKRPYKVPKEDAVLWRFMDFTKFVSLLKTKSLFFTRSDKFEDPFEGAKGLLINKKKWDKYYFEFFIEAIKTVPGDSSTNKPEKEILHEAKRLSKSLDQTGRQQAVQTFINCWYQSNYESEAMWKLYTSTLEQGVAIKTSYKRLYSSLNKNPDIKIGHINYIDFSNKFVGINDSFWYKRMSFEHEREVRAIIKDFSSTEKYGKLIPVKLDQLVEKVYLSPTSQEWFAELVTDIMKKYELNKRIQISDMRAKPFH